MANSGAPTVSSYGEGNTKGSDTRAAEGPAWSFTPCMDGNLMLENRESSLSSAANTADRAEKARSHNAATHDGEQSDGPVVPEKSPNKTTKVVAEDLEGRGPAVANPNRQNAPRTQRRISAPSALTRIRGIARKQKDVRFTALLHHVTLERLEEAYRQLKPTASPGVDGVTWADYGKALDENLQALHERVHRGAYRAKPSRRAYIPKADGTKRPLGITALEDKILQRAVAEVLSAVFEADFLGFSYGFRPGRRAHDALDSLAYAIRWTKVNYVLDADIRGYFDSIDHEWLMKFVGHRIADRRTLRLIQKWLAAGVLEGNEWRANEIGTPQGATISPLLANLYLHHVLDLWADAWRRRHAQGHVVIVRYADDFVLGFQYQCDGERFLAALRDRMQKFGLELHREKTRLIEFGRHAYDNCRRRTGHKPPTFDFLGFTHICERTPKGHFLLVRHTIAKRFRRTLQNVKAGLLRRMHLPIPQQGAWLRRVMQGYCQYYAVPTNTPRLRTFRYEVTRLWYQRLNRRSQRARVTWVRMRRLTARWLPVPTIQHPWPDQRFLVTARARAQCGKPARWDLCGGR